MAIFGSFLNCLHNYKFWINIKIQFACNLFDHPYDLSSGTSVFERNNSNVHTRTIG